MFLSHFTLNYYDQSGLTYITLFVSHEFTHFLCLPTRLILVCQSQQGNLKLICCKSQ